MTSMSRLNQRRRFGIGVVLGTAIWFGVIELSGHLDLAAQLQLPLLSYTVEQADEGRSAYLEQVRNLSR